MFLRSKDAATSEDVQFALALDPVYEESSLPNVLSEN